MSARRVLTNVGLYFNGVNQYAVVGLQPDGSGTPFTVYGWSEITIEGQIYLVHPKANDAWSKTSMIGDAWNDRIGIYFVSQGRHDYAWLNVEWSVRRSDGTSKQYLYDVAGNKNSWTHIVNRFTSARELSYWVNGNIVRSWTIPSTETTLLEWNPDTATYPQRYKRFVLGANVNFGEHMTVRYGYVRIYSRALTSEEILWNYYYPDNPVRDGLVLWLHWSSIDVERGMWYDISGFGNHARLYNNPTPAVRKALRVLPKVR